MKPRLPLSFAFLAAVLSSIALVHAQPTDRLQVPDVKSLLKLAIEHGSARGVIVGQTAAYLRQKFDATSPIEVDVRALHALPEPGCSRLQVTTRQGEVLESGKRSDKALTYDVSYCRDGRFPERK